MLVKPVLIFVFTSLAPLLASSTALASTIFVAPVPGDNDGVLTRAVETAVLKKVAGADVVTPRALDTKLEIDLVKACNGESASGDDASCVVDFAQGMGVDYVLRTTLAKLGDQRVMTMSIYHGHRAALLGQAQRKESSFAELVDDVPDLVKEVARSAELRVVVDDIKSPPYVAYGEVGGGVVLVAGSALAHVAAFLLENDYESAKYDRDTAHLWELTRPVAYGAPVLGYAVGAGLLGLGVYTLARESP